MYINFIINVLNLQFNNGINQVMEEYITKRTRICRACPICDQENEICNAHLYLNPKNNDVSTKPKPGYLKGCGCHLQWKIKNKNSHCPCGKWDAE